MNGSILCRKMEAFGERTAVRKERLGCSLITERGVFDLKHR